jgi:hypothetical protein
MVVTVELPAWQFEATGSLPLSPGALLTVILDGGAVTLDDTGGSGQLVARPQGRRQLLPVAPGQYALAGIVTGVVQAWVDDQPLLEFEVDCGVPVRFTCWPEPRSPRVDEWVSGWVALSAHLAETDTRLLGQPLTAVVREIQRLCLRADEAAFGALRTVGALPAEQFSPDVVFVTLQL